MKIIKTFHENLNSNIKVLVDGHEVEWSKVNLQCDENGPARKKIIRKRQTGSKMDFKKEPAEVEE